MSLALSAVQGTVLGKQSITLTGVDFEATAGTVTLENRPCVVTSWTAGSVVVTTPKRLTNGRIMCTADLVNLVVTLSDNVTVYTAPFQYQVTILDLTLNAIRDKIATISPSLDPNYNYTITAAQILNYQRDIQTDSSMSPKLLVYAGKTNYDGGQDQPYGFYTGKTRCVVQASVKLSATYNWDIETRLLMADLCRAIQLYRTSDPYAVSIDISDAYAEQETDTEAGSTGIVTVEFDIVWKHIRTNWQSNTAGE